MGCATATIKYLVFIFNTLCALLGIGTIIVNSLALNNVSDEVYLGCVFMIVLGSIIFIISFFGCCGAIRENICFTWTYAVFLLLLVVANLVLILCFSNEANETERASLEIDQAWAKQLNGTDAMSFYQKELHCCGKNNSQDYIVANMTIPPSCYINGGPTHIANINGTSNGNGTFTGNSTSNVIIEPAEIFTDGCLDKLIEFYTDARYLVAIFSWTTLGVEAVALIFACILAITFHNQRRRARY